jgi:hypothetical protein
MTGRLFFSRRIKGVGPGSGLLADTGVFYPPCFSAAAVDEYALIHEEKTVLRFLCGFAIGKYPADFEFASCCNKR